MDKEIHLETSIAAHANDVQHISWHNFVTSPMQCVHWEGVGG